MRTEIPIFRQIERDTKLPFRAYQVWLAAIELLDLVDWRDLKHIEIENALNIDRSMVGRGLRTLVKFGYLCREDEQPGIIARYRVPLSRTECASGDEATDTMEDVAPAAVDIKHTARRSRARTISPGVL
jgi:DNA-binding IclR family transcriptional regulator